MLPKRCAAVLVVIATTAAVRALADAPFFTGVGDLPGGSFRSGAHAVSGDGTTVVGGSDSSASGDDGAFIWTRDGGIQPLGSFLGSGGYSLARAVSFDGSVVVGDAADTNQNGFSAFRWTAATGMVRLGGCASYTFGVSNSGSVAVGTFNSGYGNCVGGAYRWTSSGGGERIPDPAGGFFREAQAVSPDGTVVVGVGRPGAVTFETALLWSSATGTLDLGSLPGAQPGSNAAGVSENGLVVVGGGSASNGGGEAFRWSSSTGMVGLGVLPEAPGTIYGGGATAVAAKGKVVVGECAIAPGTAGLRAFVWDNCNGMRNLQGVLADEWGLDLSGWTLQVAMGISADALTIVGWGTDPNGDTEGWVAHVPCRRGDADRDGSVDGEDVSFFLNALSDPASVTADTLCVFDFDRNGQIDAGDISAFVAALLCD